MKKTFLPFLAVFLCCYLPLNGQQLQHVQGEILLKLQPKIALHQWIDQWQVYESRPTQLKVRKEISQVVGIWHLSFDFTRIDENRFLEAIRKSPGVALAQFNHLIDYRATVPNDPLFNLQWQYINTGQDGGVAGADFDTEKAWDITTGGLTATGDTIVVCIVDSGVDAQHQDLRGNLWVNRAEIPNNSIDDDNNGYIDDYKGLNTTGTVPNDNITGDPRHGTSVAGIVGASGNNALGISGINWNIKLMVVTNGLNTTEAKVLEAYAYPLSFRKRYNETNGAEGAFVVATNSSWGLNFGQAEDAPLWCAFYDSLGVYGILNAGATANKIVDVDVEGDLPTACPSDYLIAVTNVDRRGQKVQAAGWGLKNIDFGAYGEDVYTLNSSNDYGPFRGTSAATPQVAGAIGLMYAAPCPAFMDIVKNAPNVAALLVKQYLMEGVIPNETLAGISVSGGVLNINNSLVALMEGCGSCPPSTNPELIKLTDTEAILKWIDFDINTRTDLRWRQTGTTNWTTVTNATSPYSFPPLSACTSYEYQLKAYCQADTLDYSAAIRFRTDGCCEPPTQTEANLSGPISAMVAWSKVLAAMSYTVRYRPDDLDDWEMVDVDTTVLNLNGLLNCTNYEVQIRTNCGGEISDFGGSFYFMTRGCGACLDLEYCVTDFLNSDNEWIERVALGPLNNRSGPDPEAYGDYTGLSFTQLTQGSSYTLILEPGYSGISFGEYFKVWIDFNQNGSFQSNEVVFDPGASTNSTLTSTITIAPNAPLGTTRMRVIMQFQNVTGTCPFTGQEFGEIEDYCIEIVPTNNCNIPIDLDTIAVGNTMSRVSWRKEPAAVDYFLRYRKSGNSDWLAAVVNDTSFLITNLAICGEYEVEVKSRCNQSQSDYSVPLVFKTSCVSHLDDPRREKINWQVSPNPASDHFMVEIKIPELQGDLDLLMFDPMGKLITRIPIGRAIPGIKQLQIPVSNVAAGLYFMQIVNNNIPLSTKKVIVF